MKAIKILLVVVLLLVVVAGTALFLANRYLQSPELKQAVLDAARKGLGSEVQITELHASLFRGAALKGLTVANPPGFTGNLLTADKFVLRYDLLPLLRKQVHIERLAIVHPVITLSKNDKAEWNYDKLGAPAANNPPATATSTAATPLDVALSKLAMADGEVVMQGEKGKLLVKLQDIDLSSSVTMEGGKLNGAGQSNIATINVADSLFIRSIGAPVAISSAEVKLAPLTGKLADGEVSGDLALKLAGGTKYVVNLQVKDGDVAKLLQEAKAKALMNGKLQSTVALEGTGGLPTIVGKGNAQIEKGTLAKMPLQDLLAALLQMPGLSELKFDECRLEFAITNNVMQTPVIRLVSHDVQVTGSGTVNLEDYSLNHTLTLAFSKETVARIPIKEIRAAFTEKSDGSATIEFRVWGPYDKPKTDLTERLAKGAVNELLDKGLKKLFK